MTASRAADAGSKAATIPAEIPARSTSKDTVAIRLREIVVVTGTPGSGKTSVSRLMARSLNGLHIDCGRLALRENLTRGYDTSTGSYIVNSHSLSRRLCQILRNVQSDVILDGHIVPRLAGYAPSRVFVLRLHPVLLLTRLKRRRYSRKKMAANVVAEILDSSVQEAVESFGIKRVVELDLSKKSPAHVSSLAIKILRGEVKGTPNHVDWIRRLEREGRLLQILEEIEAKINGKHSDKDLMMSH